MRYLRGGLLAAITLLTLGLGPPAFAVDDASSNWSSLFMPDVDIGVAMSTEPAPPDVLCIALDCDRAIAALPPPAVTPGLLESTHDQVAGVHLRDYPRAEEVTLPWAGTAGIGVRLNA